MDSITLMLVILVVLFLIGGIALSKLLYILLVVCLFVLVIRALRSDGRPLI